MSKDQNVENQKVEKNVESLIWRENFWRSDFTYGVKKDQNIESLICLIFKFYRSVNYLWRKYLWRFGLKKKIFKKLFNLS